MIMMTMTMMTLKPIMPKMIMAAKIEVAQLVKATMHASLNEEILIVIVKIEEEEFFKATI